MIITISGLPGSGKTSLALKLADMLGYKTLFPGQIRRTFADKFGVSLLELNKRKEISIKIDHLVDEAIKKAGDNTIIEGRMGFYFKPDSFKIFLKIDLMEAARRIYKGHRIAETFNSLEDAYNSLKERIAEDEKRYKELYNVDAFDEKNFDMVIDTTNKNLNEIADIVMQRIKIFK